MLVGVPKEIKTHEYRGGSAPESVASWLRNRARRRLSRA